MLLVGPDLAPPIESGPIIAGQSSYPAVLIEPDVGGVGEAPVVANVDSPRVSYVRGRLGDVMFPSRRGFGWAY